MLNEEKTKAELIQELNALRRRVAELEEAKTDLKKEKEPLRKRASTNERKPAEEALEAERGRLYSLLDGLPAFVYLQAPDHSVRFANRYFCEQFGDPEGKMCYEVLWGAKEPCKPCPTFRVFDTKKPQIWEWSKSPDGRIYEINDYPFSDVDGSALVLELGIDVTERRKAEEKIRQAAEEWQRTFDSITDLVFIVNKDFTITKTNKAFAEALKSKPEDIVGKKCHELLHKSDKSWPNCLFEKSKIDNKAHTGEVNDPNIGVPLLITTSPIFNDKGELTGAVHLAKDITERKKAEELLKAEKEQTEEFLNIVGVMLTIVSVDGNVVLINKKGCEILGCEEGELIGKNWFDTLVPQRIRDEVREVFHKLVAGDIEPVEYYENLLLTKDGEERLILFHNTILRDPNGQIVGALTSGEDITERKKAEEALRESEEKFRRLFEETADAIFVADAETGILTDCNNAAAELVGREKSELVGKHQRILHPPEEIEGEFSRTYKQHLREKEGQVLEAQVITKKGEIKDVAIRASRFELKGEKRLQAMFRDITERVRREKEFSIYHEKMARAEQLASLGTLSAILTHELTQPLTAISLSVENSLAELETASCPSTITEALKDSLTEVLHAVSIVKRFRSFARKSSKQTVSEVDLGAVVSRVVQLLSESARRARVSLRVKGMVELPPIYSNKKDLEQLFFALIDNAIQAADGKKSRRLIIGGAVRDEHIEMQFSDNCGGIAQENLGKIFQPFFTTKPAEEGTGLGLCIVKRIASRTGGNVRVESRDGKGSTFFVTLPINRGKTS